MISLLCTQTIDFSDLTDADLAVFKKHDLVNPHPRVGRGKLNPAQPSLQAPLMEADVEGQEGYLASEHVPGKKLCVRGRCVCVCVCVCDV